ncbi:hypothetical protein TNCV_3661031 [Trichonephila clavipes]|nr:hypothetical protein TNCV_3661031 [Trichonephila clavipes]
MNITVALFSYSRTYGDGPRSFNHGQVTSRHQSAPHLNSTSRHRVDFDEFKVHQPLCKGYVKSLVYADKSQTLDHLEDNIRRVIADIRPQMLEKVIENWTSRLDYIRASRGSLMPEIIFKI